MFIFYNAPTLRVAPKREVHRLDSSPVALPSSRGHCNSHRPFLTTLPAACLLSPAHPRQLCCSAAPLQHSAGSEVKTEQPFQLLPFFLEPDASHRVRTRENGMTGASTAHTPVCGHLLCRAHTLAISRSSREEPHSLSGSKGWSWRTGCSCSKLLVFSLFF